MTRKPARSWTLLAALPLAAIMAAGVCAQAATGGAGASGKASAASDRAVLSRGTLSLKGVPFFSANKVACLYGAYRHGDAEMEAWFTREPLYRSSLWKPALVRDPLPAGASVFRYAPAPGGEEGVAEGKSAVSVLLVVFDGASAVFAFGKGETREGAMISTFLDRLSFFMRNSGGGSSLSFPATLELK